MVPAFDGARAEAVRELLIAVGEDPDRPGLKDTPPRVARGYAETISGLRQDPGEVLATTLDDHHDELVLVSDIPMYSTCEHHLVRFHGVAHIGHIPGGEGKVPGLSKLARPDAAHDPSADRGAIRHFEEQHAQVAARIEVGRNRPG